MGLFGKKQPKSFLGVDIGASSIKVDELEAKKGRPVLMTYGYAEIPAEEAGESLFDQPKKTGELLARVCKEAGTKSTSAMAALPTSHVFAAILALPDGKDQRQRQASVDAEASKLAPLPLSEMIIQTTYLDEEGKGEKKGGKGEKVMESEKPKQKQFRAMVTGSAKTFIQKYIEIFKAAKLNLQAIDTESLALVRALIGKDKGAIMVIDIGSQRSTLMIVEKGIPFVSRSIQLGGDTVTRAIMSQMNLGESDAERIKRDLGTASPTAPGSDTGLPKVLEVLALPLLNEIRFAFQLYASMELALIKKVEKIVVTGGSSHLPHLPEYLARTLNLNVYRGDPWARVVYPQDLGSVLEEIGPRMSVAIGLAMREIE
ncbi:type IV pilus assembly protein PilM [Candidatus Uhrbacteria bacterium]|nr:type IV pilus assembly protein PilM [Candidatus Uhrbacteria bacterium]